MMADEGAATKDVGGREHSTSITARRASLDPLPIVLRVENARAHPSTFRLSSGRCILGAGSEAEVVIEADTVSRQHAELCLVPEGVAVTDLGSKNGCFYLGQRFQHMTLHPGSRFRIGTVEVQISIDAETLSREDARQPSSYGDLIGISARMRQLFAQLLRLEGSKVNLLIAGESGTGKELIARAVHEHSAVYQGPFIVVNCGALDRQLVRSELFGHQRGAFTGAVSRHIGAFEAASGGTLFLDEIGELPIDVQPMLLRALEERKVTPVGSHDEVPFDVRLITATHRDLSADVRAGTFREDLFYRVQVVRIEVPPLREHLEDIPVIARELARRQGVPSLPDDFIEALGNHRWPGNVRELRNAVEAYLALGEPPALTSSTDPDDIESALARFVNPGKSYADQKQELMQRFTRAYLTHLMQRTGGNQSEAARVSGLERTYIGRLIGRLGLRGS
jgi:two-component system, NtrC family, response regulator GlrR